MTDCQGDSLHASRAKTTQCRKHVSTVAIPRQLSVESSRLRLSIIMTRNLGAHKGLDYSCQGSARTVRTSILFMRYDPVKCIRQRWQDEVLSRKWP